MVTEAECSVGLNEIGWVEVGENELWVSVLDGDIEKKQQLPPGSLLRVK